MGGIFDIDSPVMNVLNKIMNLIILNVCFVISCVPVVTAGAAATALYSVNLKMARNEESYVFSSYVRAFRDNFRQSTCCWLFLMCAGGIIGADFWVIGSMTGTIQRVFQVTTIVFLVSYCVLLLYIFPYIARFQDTVRTSIKNAFLIGCVNLGYTVTIVLITAAGIAVTVSSIEVMLRAAFIWVTVGFSLLAYIQSIFFRKVFDKYEQN